MNKVDLLTQTQMFEGLDQGDVEALAGELRVHQLVPGDTVFREGEVGNSMYIVASGRVSILLGGVDPSSRVTVASIEAGTCFGELSLFDNRPRSATAEVTRDTVLLELGQESFVRCLAQRPHVAMGILRTMSGRLRGTNEILRERAAQYATKMGERNASLADRLADTVSAFNGSWTFIILLSTATVAWAIFNLPALQRAPVDPYPYIFYNLVIAIFIALQWPLIVMAQNRRAAKERAEAELDYKVNLKNETHCEMLLAELREFRREWKGRETELAGLLAPIRHSPSALKPET